MSSLQSYNPFGGSQYLTPSQVPEKLLKSYTIASGATSITISDSAFSLTTYKGIHVRINNPRGTLTSGSFRGLPIKNGDAVSGTYYITSDAPSSTTATGWATTSSTGTVMPLNSTAMNLTNRVSQIDLYLSQNGCTYSFDAFQSNASVRYKGTISFPSFSQTFTSSDYIGFIFAVSAETFTGGTIDVYGEV